MPLECKVERCSGGGGLDEVLGTYIFHCPCQALYCFLSLVSQRWCFLKLSLVEVDSSPGFILSKVSGSSVVSHSEWHPGMFPMPEGKRGVLGRTAGHAKVLFGGTTCAVTCSPRGCCVCVLGSAGSHATGDEKHFGNLAGTGLA